MALRSNSSLRQCLRLVAQVERPSLQPATTRSCTPYRPTSRTCYSIPTTRSFSVCAPLHKKRKIAPASDSPPKPSATAQNDSSSASSSSKAKPDAEDPLDFSSLISAFGPVDTHFKSQLQGMLHGGRFNPDSLGALPVEVKSHLEGQDGQQGAAVVNTFPLRELAQVVPRPGRTVSLLVNDREYIKPIMTAVQASPDYNQQPQRSEDNDLELLLRVELQRKDDAARRVKEAAQAWRERIRQARSKHDKVLKDWKKNKVVVADVIKKAEKELQKVQDRKMKEIDDEEARTIKQL